MTEIKQGKPEAVPAPEQELPARRLYAWGGRVPAEEEAHHDGNSTKSHVPQTNKRFGEPQLD